MQHRMKKRKWWRVLGRRRCACGLPWPCLGAWLDERRESEEGRLHTNVSAAETDTPGWAGMTVPVYYIGPIASFTQDQLRRSWGGR